MSHRATVPILLVEDDATMSRLARHLLEMEGYRAIRHAWTGEEAVAMAGQAEIILLDQQLPDVRGLELLPRLLGRPNPPSVIMVTAHGSESLAATALRQGAEDYLTKDHSLPELLPRIVERVRRTRALRGALDAAEVELVRTERLAAIGEISVTLHHELNNPLMAALAEVDLALADTGLSPPSREGLMVARAALLRIRDTLRRTAELKRAEAVEYLGGVRMVDLAEGPGAEPPFRGRAVLQVADPRLARILSLLLRRAGFQVERTASREDAQRAAADPAVSLVLLGSEAQPEGFPPPGARRYTLVRLREPEGGESAADADVEVSLPFDPATLVDELLAARRDAATATPTPVARTGTPSPEAG